MTETLRIGAAHAEPQFEPYRVELTGYCYRMLGSPFDAEDAVQETFVRAWRSFEGFEGRAALRSWLYRIATNVCYDILHSRKRRALPMDLTPSSRGDASLGGRLPEGGWVQPVPDGRVMPLDDPAELAASRETVRLAFVSALQRLTPRQRAVLILRDVLRWRAAEVAELLGTTTVSVKSALQRARSALAAANATAANQSLVVDNGQQALLARYVDAFERYDVESLVGLLREDATMSMPPYAFWLQGVTDIRRWFIRKRPSAEGSQLVSVAANGAPAFGHYKPTGPAGELEAFAIQVVDTSADRISAIYTFVDSDLFPLFDLPYRLGR